VVHKTDPDVMEAFAVHRRERQGLGRCSTSSPRPTGSA
jgi:hypothetical protein